MINAGTITTSATVRRSPRTPRRIRQAIETAPAPVGGPYALVSLDPSSEPLFERIFNHIAHERIVIVSPVTYGSGGVHLKIVGDSGAIGRLVDALPQSVDIQVHETSHRHGTTDVPANALTERRRAALVAALDLGYYDQPRRCTHGDVADRLECAPSTASEHLHKAEAKLVRATFPARIR